MISQSKKEVAVIGGGPSGLLAIKYALYYGFLPYGFEKNQNIGGVWNPQKGAVWKQMRTNLSKYTCSFSDFPWPEESPTYPTSSQMMEYLKNYICKYNLLKYIRFNTEIVLIEKKIEEQKTFYVVSSKENGNIIKKNFQFVIIASGIFSIPNVPQFDESFKFKGKIMHSKFYKHGQEYKGKKVLVVGGSFTGIQLASNIAKYAIKVIHSFKKSFWVLPHYIGPIGKKLPIDFFYTRQFYLSQQSKSPNFDKNLRYSKTLCKQQQQIKQLKVNEQSFQEPIYVSISSDYLQQTKNGKIFPIKSKIQKLQENRVYLTLINDRGQALGSISQQIDDIILCTGYKSSLGFLSKGIMEILQYDQNDRLQPIILYKQMYHPQLDKMFFVGMYKGPYFAVMQLQVKAAFQYFINQAKVPSREQIEKSLKEERQIRQKKVRDQFPHPDYIKFADGIAKFAGNKLQIQKLISDAKRFDEKEQLRGNLKIKEQSKLSKDFFKMAVFPCFPNAFTSENIQNQINLSAQLIKFHSNQVQK